MTRRADLPPREKIVLTSRWRVAHSFNSSLPGWLVALPIRHVEAFDELDHDELAEMGVLLGDLTRALRTVTGCVKTYVMMFAEAEGFSHLHIHVVPRMPAWSDEHTGPRSMPAFLARPPDECVSAEEMDRLSNALKDVADRS